ncbi:MAG: bifunctional alpha,alpha-trehalose-phosphate synthase (UDP-forming)/trehalose-phosphatase [Acidimicrobiia bacterium]|nr:bifunctional alpha,alpha-trehalose-phosphate synthase (UDP-forming)/trehalose-phosphatase [Acidimicrobiia bacterium]
MSGRVVAVANRLPVRRTAAGGWEISPGGLVSALAPILRDSGGAWIGWSGVPDDHPEPFVHDGIAQHAVPLSAAEYADYYLGFCNSSLWPLYHDAIREAEFRPDWWEAYRSVNRRFAQAVAAQHDPGDLTWVHDYQLQLVPALLRRLQPNARIGYFLHIPFPPVEIFARLPWRRQILSGLLGADVIGFQTERSLGNFLAAAERFTDAVVGRRALAVGGRWVQVQCAPISIDTAGYEALAAQPRVRRRAAEIRAEIGRPARILLGADRLDYTKGIDVRLLALERLLEQQPRLAEEIVLIQIASPSREPIGDYEAMRARIEQLVGRINGSHGAAHTVPVHYVYGNLPTEELVAYFVLADVMCVTPLADGMNLVAKEYVASRPADEGVLLLSEFAGAAAELEGALLVNPYDLEGLAAAMAAALEMSPGEQAARLRAMRTRVRLHDVHAWAAHCLGALEHPEMPQGEVAEELTGPAVEAARYRPSGEPGPPDALEAFDEITATLRYRPVVVFLDFDGTLSPIVEDPDAAVLPARERKAVEALARRVPVAVVSGRDLEDVQRRVGIPGLWYVGGHGNALADPAGAVVGDTAGIGTDSVTDLLDTAEADLRRRLQGADSGVVIERKRASLTVHYRRAPHSLRRVREAAEATVASLPELRLSAGRALFELHPGDAWDKGTAVRWLLGRISPDRGAVPLYLGDDTTDETAFRAIAADGIGVLVGRVAVGTAAGYRLGERRHVADFLNRLAKLAAREDGGSPDDR